MRDYPIQSSECALTSLVLREILFRIRSMSCDGFSSDGEVIISASVATGLENVAASEVQEKITGEKVVTKQGRVYMKTSAEFLSKVHQLRSVDRLFLIVKTWPNYVYKETKDEIYEDLTKLAHELQWSEILKFWAINKQFCKGKSRQENLSKKRNGTKRKHENPANECADPQNDIVNESESPPTKVNCEKIEDANICNIVTDLSNSSVVPLHAPDGTQVRFRVSSNRVGKKQPITSPEASYKFGGQIQNVTNWKVDLSNYNFEILLCLGESSLEVAVALTLQSLHRRNITHFGVTTLRATTAYSMLRLCKIQPGEIVIDPMCGTGAIPVEGALEWPQNFYIGGDNVNAAVARYLGNVTYINENRKLPGDDAIRKKLRTDMMRWDVTNLPIKSNCVDVIVTDLPFGKRIGSKVDNRRLYPALLKDLARVTRCGTGRACLLTQDKRTIKRALDGMTKLWHLNRTLLINIGGLTAGIFLLQRTKLLFENIVEN